MAQDEGPGGQQIRYPSVVDTLGKKYEGQWTSTAHDQLKLIRDSVTEPAHFGEIPAARDFASVYAAARHVYEATLRGIKDDLEAAGSALAQAGTEMKERDQVSSEGFRQLMARWGVGGDGLSSSQQHDDASDDRPATEGGEAKVRLETDTAPAGDPATPEDPTVDTSTSDEEPVPDATDDAPPPASPTMGTDG